MSTTPKIHRTTHTPGPWFIGEDEQGSALCAIIAQGNGPVATVDSDFAHDGENWGNAYLIAAAPEMKDALEFIAFCLAGRVDHKISPSFTTLQTLVEKATAAIAKAEGR